jgi:hypothetical protein
MIQNILMKVGNWEVNVTGIITAPMSAIRSTFSAHGVFLLYLNMYFSSEHYYKSKHSQECFILFSIQYMVYRSYICPSTLKETSMS